MSINGKNYLIKVVLDHYLPSDTISEIIKFYGYLQYHELYLFLSSTPSHPFVFYDFLLGRESRKQTRKQIHLLMDKYRDTNDTSIFDQIHILNFSFYNLEQIPGEISLLKNLSSLNLEGNRLTDLPKDMSYLTNLKKLDLEKNKFTKVPDVLEKINLDLLYLHANPLVEIPSFLTPNFVGKTIISYSYTQCKLSWYDKFINGIYNIITSIFIQPVYVLYRKLTSLFP